MRRRGVRMLWPRVALADTFLQYAWTVRLAMRSSDVVICDRYVWDAVIDLRLSFPEAPLSDALPSSKMLAAPDLALLISVPWDLVVERSTAKNEPFPDPPETRRRRYDLYQEVSRGAAFTVIDGSDGIEAVHRRIVAAMEACMVAA